MSLTLIVERTVVPGSQNEIKDLLRELRSGATRRPGFISGRSVVDAYNPLTFMTISVWASISVWEMWENSPERTAIVERINDLIQGKPIQRLWLDDEDAPV